MYEELIRVLRHCGNPNVSCKGCSDEKDCMGAEGAWEIGAMSNMRAAADAIEELQQTVEHYKGCADDWYKEACDYKAMLPRWIPVTERLPESSGKYLVSGGGKVWICDFWRIAGVRGWCDSVNNPVVGYWMPLPPEPPKEETYRDFKPITNYTRLVAKSPKELVEWINRVESDARYYGPKGKDVWLKWLQEVDNG